MEPFSQPVLTWGQGLAAGLNSALGAVTAAANALVAQAERAAQAKAKIHSPSHLFRDQVGWYIGLGIARGIDESAPEVANSLDYIRDQVNGFNVRANAMLTGATSNMASQLKMEVLRDKTPDAAISARQEAYAAHSAGLLSDVIDALGELKDQVAQGQNMVLDTGALVGGTVNNFNSAIDTINTERTTQIMITKIKEYISFGDFNSRDEGWYLQKREAPTPSEKEIV